MVKELLPVKLDDFLPLGFGKALFCHVGQDSELLQDRDDSYLLSQLLVSLDH